MDGYQVGTYRCTRTNRFSFDMKRIEVFVLYSDDTLILHQVGFSM